MRPPGHLIQGLAELNRCGIDRVWGWDDETIFAQLEGWAEDFLDGERGLDRRLLHDLGWREGSAGEWGWRQEGES